MSKYNPKDLEAKWQQTWQKTGIYKTDEDPERENFYCLVMFPYPSGDLHAGHWYNFGPADTYARFNRMLGKNVLHPIGFDAFGLPAENAAIKRGVAPAEWTDKNIASMKKQLQLLGAMYDLDRLVDTSKPEYYRWTQWLFLQLYKKGLAYRAKGMQNWCPTDQTVLANEQVVGENNVCERCGTPVIKKELEQWFFKITDYADRLLFDLNKVEWPEKVKTMQANWIGRSEGAEVDFEVEGEKVKVYTTRPDTLAGATLLVLAPEHPLVDKITAESQKQEVKAYQERVSRETELDRLEEKEKTGVFTGAYAVNPLTGEKLPVWIADYVLMSYGTGAIMAVPAHDVRDYAFAKKFDLPIREVVSGGDIAKEAYAGAGKLINSGEFDGLEGVEAKRAIVKKLFDEGNGKGATKYRLRDWLISRQRYWGAPIPIIYCKECGTVPVPEDQLPVVLPTDVAFTPTGRSPLEERADFYQTKCPECGGQAHRETDTMDTFVDSSWYYLRYPSNTYDKGPFDSEKVNKWLPVDQYIGGVEHAILHLLYSRFITKVLHDQKLISFDEPFAKLYNQGLIMGPDGQKMSKSRGNVVNPDDWVEKYGSDTFRMYLMFMGPYDQGGPFDTGGIGGVYRFLNRVHDFGLEVAAAKYSGEANTILETALDRATHKGMKAVGEAIGLFKFNIAISTLMSLMNEFQELRREYGVESEGWRKAMKNFVLMLAPLAPHLAEELWRELGEETSVHVTSWPKYSPELIRDDLVEIAVQVNGKLRGTVVVPVEAAQEEIEKAAAEAEGVTRYLEGGTLLKTIVVPRKIVNFVVKEG